MQLFFSPPKSQFHLLLPNPNPRFFFKLPYSTRISSQSPLQEQILCSDSDSDSDDEEREQVQAKEKNSGTVLEVRRPIKEVSEDEWSVSKEIDTKLTEMAKKMSVFEPERVGSSSSAAAAAPREKPLGVNLELGLYRAKVLTRKFQFQEAEEILQKCILFWPEDGRAYVALGKLLKKQSRLAEARSVYERGSQATQGENPYIWQCWAVLENKVGNIRKARELFDAATVADKRHIAAWHGWAVLEIKEGNIKKARNLLGKGLKFCGGNEYIYQSLALLEAKGNRFEQARYLFKQATKCNPKSCASWLAWAQIEMQQENNRLARQLFEKAVQASPKNRFAWHVWAIFEANQGNIDIGRKLLKIGHALNPRDPVILQSLALLEYKHSTANLARLLFRRASELDPRHQPVWIAWGWMEWKEGNTRTARELYQKALSTNATSESAARCLQAWGVLEQRIGNLSAARRLFRSSLNINSQSYITWMTWASLEEDQGNPVRAEEIRNLYFQQRTEVVDNTSWGTGFMDIFDPALDSIKRLLNFNKDFDPKTRDILRMEGKVNSTGDADSPSSQLSSEESQGLPLSDFNLDAFIKDKLSLDPSKLDIQSEVLKRDEVNSRRRLWIRSERKTVLAQP